MSNHARWFWLLFAVTMLCSSWLWSYRGVAYGLAAYTLGFLIMQLLRLKPILRR